jgi:hypothetical protein
MLEVLALQAVEQDEFEPDLNANSDWSVCCSGCNSAASTGGCGSQTRLA